MKYRLISFLFLPGILLIFYFGLACNSETGPAEESMQTEDTTTPSMPVMWLGADLSYVNEMEDCGGKYRKDGQVKDPFELFAQAGCKMVRLRLWHNPSWTDYSSLDDVIRASRRAKNANMEVLLDFHYSDDWADPSKQIIPDAWATISNNDILADSLYSYTHSVLMQLYTEDLMPRIVQVGNEINSEILMSQPAEQSPPLNWDRNTRLLNKGLLAIRDAAESTGVPLETMIHIAQPENAFWWFQQAFDAGLEPFDWMGLSYYPKWSEYDLEDMGEAIDSLKKLYNTRIMIVETAYPYTLENADEAGNILGEDALITNYQASPEGQKAYLLKLTEEVIQGGGEGIIYWEPAWISTACSTRWGNGSHWDNATFFDASNKNESLPAFDFFNKK